MWILNHCNGVQTQNHLVLKRTLYHLAKLVEWLSCVVSTYLYGAFDCIICKRSLNHLAKLANFYSKTRIWYVKNIQWILKKSNFTSLVRFLKCIYQLTYFYYVLLIFLLSKGIRSRYQIDIWWGVAAVFCTKICISVFWEVFNLWTLLFQTR